MLNLLTTLLTLLGIIVVGYILVIAAITGFVVIAAVIDKAVDIFRGNGGKNGRNGRI